MAKLKTKSSAKKRFSITSKGKVLSTQSGKNHLMRRRTKSQIRNLRRTTIICNQEAKKIKKFFLPYGA